MNTDKVYGISDNIPWRAGAMGVSEAKGKQPNQEHTRATETRTLKVQFPFWKILILKRFDKVLVNKPHSWKRNNGYEYT